MFSNHSYTLFNTKPPEKAQPASTVHITHVKILHAPAYEEGYEYICSDKKSFNQVCAQNFDKHTLSERVEFLRDNIARSQFNVATTILNHPNAAIVREGRSNLMHHQSSRFDHTAKENICKSFQYSSFNDFSHLSSQQKELLIQYGGDQILFYLGFVSFIHPSIDFVNARKLWNDMKSCQGEGACQKLQEVEKKWRTLREQKALAFCLTAARDENKQEVLLLFGQGHNFKTYESTHEPHFCLQEPVNTCGRQMLNLQRQTPATQTPPQINQETAPDMTDTSREQYTVDLQRDSIPNSGRRSN